MGIAAFMAILVVALLAALCSFVGMGIRHSWRANVLTKKSAALGARFSREDPFDIPHKYADFALISSGHSPRGFNVAHGRVNDCEMRAFDFRCEVGHGTRRMTRQYSVVVIESQSELPDLLMWHDCDAVNAPLKVRQIDGHIGNWSFIGDNRLARAMQVGLGELGELGLSVQVQGQTIMLMLPAQGGRRWDYTTWLDQALRLPEAIVDWQTCELEIADDEA